MGAGKTTIGRTLARKLGVPFADSDHEIEKRCGTAIPVIFELEGEPAFRNREVEVIASLLTEPAIVLSTGGGAVIRTETRERLCREDCVVYLHATPDVLYQRTRTDRNRPLLATGDRRATIERLYRERDPLYREVATLIIETGQPKPVAIADAIIRQLPFTARVHANAPR